MNKTFCDMCESNAVAGGTKIKIFKDIKVKCQKGAQIKMRVTTSFAKHPTGYAGPPDLCADCYIKLLEGMVGDLKDKPPKDPPAKYPTVSVAEGLSVKRGLDGHWISFKANGQFASLNVENTFPEGSICSGAIRSWVTKILEEK